MGNLRCLRVSNALPMLYDSGYNLWVRDKIHFDPALLRPDKMKMILSLLSVVIARFMTHACLLVFK